jgi:octaprenyl-diphosphate synthase
LHANPHSASNEALDLHDLLAPVRVDLERVTRELADDLRPGSDDLLPLLEHVGAYRGKQLRPSLVFLAGRALGGLVPAHDTVAKVVELIHLATLVHDDVLDGADLRRRGASLNRLHGNEASVLLGDYIYARAFHMSVMLEDLTCSRHLAEVTRVMCRGEITQILHRFDFDWTEPRYFAVIRDKTASLYAAACRLGAHYAGAGSDELEAVERFGERLGTAFQIVDDCLDLDGDEEVVGKSLGTDLAKGKLTLPLLFLLRDPLDGPRLERLMQTGPDGGGLVRLRAEFDLARAVDYAMAAARAFIDEAAVELASLPDTPARAAMLGLADYVLRRDL